MNALARPLASPAALPAIWIQTESGRAFDLLAPEAAMVDFACDVPNALARITRFTGHVGSGVYSVAQHCVIGADHILRTTGDRDLAAAFLLHDAHEAYLGDIATPIKLALSAHADAEFETKGGYPAGFIVKAALRRIAKTLDRAIYAAAGLPWPLPAIRAQAVKGVDLAMLNTERRLFMAPSPGPWLPEIEAAGTVPLTGREARLWAWPDAADAWRARFALLCPQGVR